MTPSQSRRANPSTNLRGNSYRDFVIRAFNDDMPYDRFVAWQLAGDELAPDDPDAWAATGFLAAGPSAIPNPTDSKANKDKQRYDELDDVVSTIGAGFLGLTVGCARCHDHKYDPFTSRDYYGMVATFITTGRGDRPLGRAQREWEDFRARARVWLRERKMADLHIDDADRDLLRVDLQPNNPTQSRVWKRWNGQLKFADDELRLALPAAAAFSGMI